MIIKVIMVFHNFMIEKNMDEASFIKYNYAFLYLANSLTNDPDLENWFYESLLDLIFWDGKTLDLIYPFGNTTVSSIMNEGVFGIQLMKYSEWAFKQEKTLKIKEGLFGVFITAV